MGRGDGGGELGKRRVDGKHGKYQDNYEQVQPRAQESTASLKLHLNKRTRMCTYAVSHGLARKNLCRSLSALRIYVKNHLRQTGWLLILVNRREDLRVDGNY